MTVFNNNETVVFPLNPEHVLTGVEIDTATVFKSNTSPICVTFHTTTQQKLRTIFKVNDDLRQDHIVLQVLSMMDELLKKQGLDMQLTPYRVLPCGTSAGFVECVTPSTTVEKIVKIDRTTIFKWLQEQCDKGLSMGVTIEQARKNYITSCAGYCVISYVLGIGDRHLENLLLSPNGKLFHIDFGFICGVEPPTKSMLAPEMKLSKEMIEGFGGKKAFTEFCIQSAACYTALRRHADLYINMFELMADAGIGNITKDGIELIKDRFCLTMQQENAEDHILQVIDDCAGSLLPAYADSARTIVQGMRN